MEKKPKQTKTRGKTKVCNEDISNQTKRRSSIFGGFQFLWVPWKCL